MGKRPKKTLKSTENLPATHSAFDAKSMWHRGLEKLEESWVEEAVKSVNLSDEKTAATAMVMDLRSVDCRETTQDKLYMPLLTKPEYSNKRSLHDDCQLQAEKNELLVTPDAKIHLLLDDPSSSRAAMIYSIIMGVIIVTSVAGMVARALITDGGDFRSQSARKIWKVFESLFTITFMSELVVRFAVADALGTQTRIDFMKKPMNICDFLACLPYFFEGSDFAESQSIWAKTARLLRIARVLRIARLTQRIQVCGPMSAVFTVIWAIYLKQTTLK